MMTKQLREKLIPSRISSPPRISSSYGNHTHIAVDTANGNNRKNNNKWNWPNKIDMLAATVNVLSAIFAFIILRTNMQFQSYIISHIVFSGILTVSIAVAWLFGYPIGRAIVSDKVEDMVPYTHPVVIHFIQLTSGVMLCTFFLNFMLSIVAKVFHDHGEKETASAFCVLCCILYTSGMVFFISCYGLYFNINIEKIAAKYEKEISKQMDNTSYHSNNNHENDYN